VTIVRTQISPGHVVEGRAEFAVLAIKLHFPGRIDIEKFAVPQAFPGTRVIAAQHFLRMLAVQAHPGKELMLGSQAHVLVTLNSDVSTRPVQQRETTIERQRGEELTEGAIRLIRVLRQH
jgi:hypothetical protein